MIRLILLLATLTAVTGCSWLPSLDSVVPDKRTEYKKAEPLPDLEVPPDLTAEQPSQNMAIPGEEGASLSQYRRSRAAPAGGPSTGAAGGGSSASGSDLASQQWVSVNGSAEDVWPKLASFFQGKGFSLQLNDAGLGVMETGWSAPKNVDGGTVRDKYQIVSEPGAESGVTVLFVTNIRQEKVGEDRWQKQGEDTAAEKQLAGELNVYLNGASASGRTAGGGGAAPTAAAAGARAGGAELQDAGDNKRLLALPDEYTRAWQNTRTALDRAGFSITGSDDAKGLYYISYHDNEASRDRSWLSKLAFWKKDDTEGIPYVLSLTGDGDRTKLIVLDEKGDWIGGDDADRILTLVRNSYNSL